MSTFIFDPHRHPVPHSSPTLGLIPRDCNSQQTLWQEPHAMASREKCCRLASPVTQLKGSQGRVN